MPSANLATPSVQFNTYACHTLLVYSIQSPYTFQCLSTCIPTSHATFYIYSMCVQSHDTFNAVQCLFMPHSFGIFNAKSLHIPMPDKMHTVPCHITHIQRVYKGKFDICAISRHIESSTMPIHAILLSLSIQNPDTFQCIPKCIEHRLVS